MGGDGGAPEPSAEERSLQQQQADSLREQTDLLRESRRMQELLAPILYDEVGLTPTYEDVANPQYASIQSRIDSLRSQIGSRSGDAPGGKGAPDDDTDKLRSELSTLEQQLSGMTATQRKLTGFSKVERPEDKLRKEIELKLLERTKAGLAGELPVDPALMSDLAERERTLEEELSRDFGSLSAARTSSAGIERINKFNEMKESILTQARRGDISFGQQLAQSQGGDNMNRFVGARSNVVGLPFNPSGYNGLNQSLAQAIGGYRSDRYASAELDARERSDRYGLVGTVAGAGTSLAIF